MKENDLHTMSRDAEFDARCRSLLEGREVTPPPMRPGIMAEASPMWNRTRTLAAGALMLAAASWWFAATDDPAPGPVDGPSRVVPMDGPSQGDPAVVQMPAAEKVSLDPPTAVAAPEDDGAANTPAEAGRLDGRTESGPGQAEAAREEGGVQVSESARMEEGEDVAEQPSNPALEDAGMEVPSGAVEGAAPEAMEEPLNGASAADDAPADEGQQKTEEEMDSDSPDVPKIRLPLTLPSGGGQR